MTLIRRGTVWHYDFTYKGERHRGTTGCESKWEAKSVEDEARRKVKSGSKGGNLSDALNLWKKERTRSKNELQAIDRLLKSYPDRPLNEIGEDIRSAIDGSPATKNRTISIINSAFGIARRNNLSAPGNVKKFTVTQNKLRFLTEQEWTRLEKELSGHVLHICQFALYTGLRSANVLGLKWSEVNLENRTVWVDASEAKGRKSIPVPLSEKAVAILREIQLHKSEAQEFVFVYKGKPVKSIKTAFNKALDRAGIKDFRFHDLRHTWASWKVQKGVPLMVVKELGGWADISMVQRYGHLSPQHLRQWVD